MMGGSTAATVALVAAATLGGARVAYAFRGARRTVLAVAAAALLAVVTFDLIPDIIRDVADVGSGRRLVAAGCLAAFAGAVVVAGRVCACGRHPTMTGVAISLHRALEGAALALLSSAGIVAALVAHAAGEGFALQTFGAHRVRQLLVLACISPATGAAAFGGVELPGNEAPVVTAVIAGTLIAAALRMLASVRDPAPA